jgi:hypothetical protein
VSSPDPYTPSSYRGALFMLVLILAGVIFVWLAYSAALKTDFGQGLDPVNPVPAITAQPSAP